MRTPYPPLEPTDNSGGMYIKRAQDLYKQIMETNSMTGAVQMYLQLKTIVEEKLHDDYSIVFPDKTDEEVRIALKDKLRALHEEAGKKSFVVESQDSAIKR